MRIVHRGYIFMQSEINYHYMIIKDGKMILHSSSIKKLTKEEAKMEIDEFIKLELELEE